MSGYRSNISGTLSNRFRIGKNGITIITDTIDPNANEVQGIAGDIFVQGGIDPTAYQFRDGVWIALNVPRRTTISSPTYPIMRSDQYVGVRTGAATTLTLPPGADGLYFTIKDELGVAATHPITIEASSMDTIDGQTTYVINNNYGKVTLLFGTEWHVI